MLIRLLWHTPNPEEVVYVAARLCYSRLSVREIEGEARRKSPAELIRRLKASGHHSVFEHASFTFSLEGVSRVTTHQLVRHRIASYSQRSQRYVSEEGFACVVPPGVSAVSGAEEVFLEAVEAARDAYEKLVELGVDREDARYVLPQGVETKIIVTMNARELMHFFTLRCCNRAQWEIREVAKRMLSEVKRVAPVLFEDAGPACLRGPCPEGEFSCGRQEEVRREFALL